MDEVVGGAALLTVGIVGRIFHKAVHSLDNDDKLAKGSYDRIERRDAMAMLVHWGYFRDLNPLEEAAAWLMEYNNERAQDYGEECWERHPCQAKESELQELGLAFLRRKYTHFNPNAPDLAIVLRGTIPTRVADLVADWKIGIQQLDEATYRVARISQLIKQVVEKFRRDHPGKQICMAGHSLGAAIALIVGGCLYATHRINIDTHLFNPPLLTLVDVARGLPPSTPPEDTCCLSFDFSKLKEALVFDKAALNKEWNQFERLKDWVPHIYLNPGDPICRQYIAFYKSREGRPVRRAADLIPSQGVLSGLFLSGLFSEDVKYLKNVVPSAHLCISTWRAKPKWYHGYAKLAPGTMREAIVGRLPHSLRQWHKYTEEYIEFREHKVRLLQQPHSREPTVSPRILDYS